MPTPSDEPAAARSCRHCGARLKAMARGSVCPACMFAATEKFPGSDEPQPVESRGEVPVIFGDYVLEKELAHGGMGVVYRARQVSLDRTVAVKLLLLGRYSSAESLQRFRREAQSAALLQHPGIVAIHEIGECEGQPFIAMEYVEGGSLAALLRERPLPPRRAAEIIRAVALALHHAHEQGVIQRDVKPSNLLFDARGDVRVTDFGLAKKLDGSTDLTMSGNLAGTPNYISPESAAGKHDAGGVPGDVYSLGAVLYECLTGRPPFLTESLQQTLRSIVENEPASPRTLMPRVPRDLETICLKALAKEPARRFPTALAMAEELGRWLRGEPILIRPTGVIDHGIKWARRRPAIAALSASTLLAVGAAFATLMISNREIRSAKSLAETRSEESRQRLVRMNVAAGNKLVEEGAQLESLPYLTEALRLDAGHPEREKIHRQRFAAVRDSAPKLIEFRATGPVANAAFDLTGGHIVSGFGPEGKICIWKPGSPGPDMEFFPTGPRAMCVFFDRAGRPFTADADGALQRWDAGRPAGPLLPARVRGSDIAIYSDYVDFSPDGKWLAAAVEPCGVQVFDAVSGEKRGPVLAAGKAILHVRFTPDGGLVVIAGVDMPLQMFEPESGAAVWTLDALRERVRLFSFSPDGKRIATASGARQNMMDVWDAARRERLFPAAQLTLINDCPFSPDGRSIAVATATGTSVFDADSGRPRFQADRLFYTMKVEYSADGRRFAAATLYNGVRIYESGSGLALTPWLPGQRQASAAHFSSDGRSVLMMTSGELRLWDLGASEWYAPRFPHAEMVRMRWGDGGRRAADCVHHAAEFACLECGGRERNEAARGVGGRRRLPRADDGWRWRDRDECERRRELSRSRRGAARAGATARAGDRSERTRHQRRWKFCRRIWTERRGVDLECPHARAHRPVVAGL